MLEIIQLSSQNVTDIGFGCVNLSSRVDSLLVLSELSFGFCQSLVTANVVAHGFLKHLLDQFQPGPNQTLVEEEFGYHLSAHLGLSV